MSSCDGGWEDRGPPPAVGGRAELAGEWGGESGGAGILVPAVREKSTGVRERMDLRLLESLLAAAMLALDELCTSRVRQGMGDRQGVEPISRQCSEAVR